VIAHLEDFTAPAPRALVLTSPQGTQLRRSNFTRAWSRATTAAGLSGFHFHDLRHTGNTLAGEAGATLRELMDRMGHASTRAALIYQHRTTHRDKLIADEISQRAPGRAQAIGHAAGTRQEEALMTTSLMISENTALAVRYHWERMTGIEPALSAWEFAESVRITQLEQ
jgi:Phage integrase family